MANKIYSISIGHFKSGCRGCGGKLSDRQIRLGVDICSGCGGSTTTEKERVEWQMRK